MVTNQPGDYSHIIKENKEQKKLIAELIDEIAEIASVKEGYAKAHHAYQIRYMLSSYISIDHVDLLEKVRELLKSDSTVDKLLVLVGAQIREIILKS